MGIYFGEKIYAISFCYFNSEGCEIKILEVDTSEWIPENFINNFKAVQESVKYPEDTLEKDKYFSTKQDYTTTYNEIQSNLGWFLGHLDKLQEYYKNSNNIH